jgi:thioredoxin reductase
MLKNKKYDVIIIGGSYAGLSAAMSLGRSLRKVLVIDSNTPCNEQTPHSHNFLTQDGETPSEIHRKAKEQVTQYSTVELINGLAVHGKKIETGFTITTADDITFEAKKLIFATGVKDLFPAIKNFTECWGISVIHCPYCHGFEVRNQKTAILSNGDRALHIASLVNNLTKDLTILTNGKPDFTEEQLEKLNRNNITIIEDRVIEIEHENGYIKNIVLENNSKIDFKAVYAAIPFIQHSDIPAALGCEINEQGYIKIDAFNLTTIDGVWACGDNTNPMRSVANAVASGSITGAMINKVLVDEQF